LWVNFARARIPASGKSKQPDFQGCLVRRSAKGSASKAELKIQSFQQPRFTRLAGLSQCGGHAAAGRAGAVALDSGFTRPARAPG